MWQRIGDALVLGTFSVIYRLVVMVLKMRPATRQAG